MSKTTFKDTMRKAQGKLVQHSPEILVGIGIAGMATSTVLAVKATPKALQLIEEAKHAKHDELTKVEVVKTTWKCYLPAAITGVTAAGCLIYGNNVNLRRNAALATAYKLSETAFTEYKEKVVETIGEKKEKAVKEKIMKDKMEQHPVSKSEVIVTNKGNTLCYDTLSGRYFKSDIDKLDKAINAINHQLNQNPFGYVCLNDFYEMVGLPGVKIGEDLGWKRDKGLIDYTPGSMIADDGTPCLVIIFTVEPCYDYWKSL